jgi:hypothetical protein
MTDSETPQTPYVDPPEIQRPVSKTMHGWGTALTVIGGVVVAGSFIMGIAAEDSDVINIGLLSNREMVLHAGCAGFLAGVITLAAGELKDSLEKLLER